jgi:hypothetical protein
VPSAPISFLQVFELVQSLLLHSEQVELLLVAVVQTLWPCDVEILRMSFETDL